MHHPITIHNLGISFGNKVCFEDFSTHLHYGQKIAIIGRNGSGKTSLLKLFTDTNNPSIQGLKGVSVGYVPQVIADHNDLSGGQRFNKQLTLTLSQDPDIVLLDEPTNHLDAHNRRSLMRMLSRFDGTLIVVTHDTELLRSCIDTIWHIHNQSIAVFCGAYDDYIDHLSMTKSSLEKSIMHTKKQKQQAHNAQLKEQKRQAKSAAQGKKKIAQKRWMPSVGSTYASQAQKSSGKKQSALSQKKKELSLALAQLYQPEEIVPTFSLDAHQGQAKTVLSVREGSVGYPGENPIITDITISLLSGQRIAITGANGSGKSTLIKGILGDDSVVAVGRWDRLQRSDIGYLDQHYSTLDPQLSVLQTMQEASSGWSVAESRKHLNDFLFRKNDEVQALVSTLSGGEKARLCLAVIAAKPPQLLILDEITNNLDLETKEHVRQVLTEFPGAIIAISHDASFLEDIGIEDYYEVSQGRLIYQ